MGVIALWEGTPGINQQSWVEWLICSVSDTGIAWEGEKQAYGVAGGQILGKTGDRVDKNVIMKQRPSQTTNKNIELGEGSAVSNNKQ